MLTNFALVVIFFRSKDMVKMIIVMCVHDYLNNLLPDWFHDYLHNLLPDCFQSESHEHFDQYR